MVKAVFFVEQDFTKVSKAPADTFNCHTLYCFFFCKRAFQQPYKIHSKGFRDAPVLTPKVAANATVHLLAKLIKFRCARARSYN